MKKTTTKTTRNAMNMIKTAAGNIGREIASVGLGASAAVLSANSSKLLINTTALTGQKLIDATKGGPTATVRQKGIFKKEKEIAVSDMKSLKKYKSVKYHGLYDPKNQEVLGKVASGIGTGVGIVTGAVSYGAVKSTLLDSRSSNLSDGYHLMDDTEEETFDYEGEA